MDENLMPISQLWDPVVQEDVRAKIPSHKWVKGKRINTEGYLQDVEGVYHAIGGFARLAHTANEDPKWFYNKFGDRLLPNLKQEMDVSVTILPALPRSALDGEYTEVEVISDGQQQRDLPDLRGGDDSLRPRGEGLDQGGDQAPWSFAPGAPRSAGFEDTSIQDGSSQTLRQPQDEKTSRSG